MSDDKVRSFRPHLSTVGDSPRVGMRKFWCGCIIWGLAFGGYANAQETGAAHAMYSPARVESLIEVAKNATSDAAALAAYAWVRHELPADIAPELEFRMLSALSGAAASPLLRARAAFELARLYRKRGQPNEADRIESKLGLVNTAKLLGPFENNGAMSIRDAVPAEPERHDEEIEVPGLGRPVRWQELQRNTRSGVWKIGHQLTPARGVKGLVRFAVYSSRTLPALLHLGTTGAWALSVNGEVLHTEAVEREIQLDQNAVPIHLRAGWNQVDLRVSHTAGPLEAVARITDPKGRVMPQLRFSAEPQVLATAHAARARAHRSAHSHVSIFAGCKANAGKDDRVSYEQLWTCIGLEMSLGAHDQSLRPTQLEQWVAALDREAEHSEKHNGLRFVRAHMAVAESLMDKDPTAAREHLERAVQRAPENVRALVALANLRSSQGYAGQARALFMRAAEQAGEDVWVALERMHFEREHSVASMQQRAMTYAFANAHPVPAALVAAARVSLSNDDLTDALRWLQELKKWDALHPLYLHTQLRLLEQGFDSGEGIASLNANAVEYVSLLEQALERYPEQHRLADRLAHYWYANGQETKARQFVASRKQRYPQMVEPLRLEADLALLAGNRPEAERALRAALVIAPQSKTISQLVRSLRVAEDDFESKFALAPAEMMTRPPAPGALEAGAEVLGLHLTVRYFSNGLAKLVRDQIYRIHDPEKAKGLQQIPIRYADGREVVEVLVAERISASGRTEPARRIDDRGPSGKEGGMYTDARMQLVQFGELKRGDLIHVRSRTEWVGQQNLFGDFFGLLEPVQSVIPVSDWLLAVEGPASRPLYWGGRGVPDPEITETDNHRRYVFHKEWIPRIEAEASMPPWLEQGEYISVSTYQNWSEMGRWYANMIDEQLRLNNELRAKAAELVQNIDSDEEKIRKIYEFVVESTRYVGIELGIHGWKPYPVTEVYRRKYGDCKDKASMLVALLREVGIDAQLALVRTANLGVLPDTPATMWAFNHAIAYVPSLDLYMDGTAEKSGYRELPHLDQGAMALLVASPTSTADSELRIIPVADARENFNESNYELRLDPTGAVHFQGKEKFRGTHSADQRAELQDAAQRREVVERSLSSILPGATVERLDVVSSALGEQWVEYDFRGRFPNRAVQMGQGDWLMPISLYPHGLTNSYARNSHRQHEVWLNYPWRTRNVMQYRLPAGFSVSDLPASQTIESKHLHFSQLIRKTEDGFVVEEDTQIKSRRIPLEDYEAFRSAALQADELMKRKIRISSAGARL